MPTILTLSALPDATPGLLADAVAIAAGPDGLFAVRFDGSGVTLEALAQPMSGLACATVTGGRLLVGGSPHGIASIALADVTAQAGATHSSGWQAGWMDHTQQPVVALAPAPKADEGDAPLLAACLGEGILRSTNNGHSWDLVNTGLLDTGVLALCWAPPAPSGHWPPREIVFAGSETGLMRSPAGGRAWHACVGIPGPVHAVAVAPDFHHSGVVIAAAGAGEEGGPTTLWRSSDGGRSFAPLPQPLNSCEVLLAHDGGFIAGAIDGLYDSADGLYWRPAPGSAVASGALCLLAFRHGLLAGSANGVAWLQHAI